MWITENTWHVDNREVGYIALTNAAMCDGYVCQWSPTVNGGSKFAMGIVWTLKFYAHISDW